MRYPASENFEIIRTIETSPLAMRRRLADIKIVKSTFYAWARSLCADSPKAPEDRKPSLRRIWNRIGDDVRQVSSSGLD